MTIETTAAHQEASETQGVVLIGAGTMGATLGTFLRRLSRERHLAALRCRRGERASSREGLRQGPRSLPAPTVAHLDERIVDGKRSLLIGRVLQTGSHQFAMLKQFFPHAQWPEWRGAVAGQRVQIMLTEHAASPS